MPIVDFDTECWSDPWIQERSPLGKLLFVYLWTNTHRNISGLYVITKKTIADETGLTRKQVDDFLGELDPKVKYDPVHSVCWVVKHVRRQFLRGEKISPKQKEGIRRHALKLRWHPFFRDFSDAYPEIFLPGEADTLLKGVDTLSKGIDTLGGGGKGNSFSLEGKKKEKEGAGEKEKGKGTNGFACFWDAYPKKKSKGQAEKAWSKIKPNEQLLATMLAKIEQARTSVEWTREGGQFIPYPATWLNAKGWEDEYTPPSQFSPQPGMDAWLKRKLAEEGE